MLAMVEQLLKSDRNIVVKVTLTLSLKFQLSCIKLLSLAMASAQHDSETLVYYLSVIENGFISTQTSCIRGHC